MSACNVTHLVTGIDEGCQNDKIKGHLDAQHLKDMSGELQSASSRVQAWLYAASAPVASRPAV